MFNQNKTIPIIVNDSSEKVQIDVYLNSKWFNGYVLKHYKADATIKFDKASLKSTESLNSENTNHIKELSISTNAEVGWLLVKKEQTFDSLLKLIYKKVPTRSELDIFRHANAHISDLQDLNLNKNIKPGQIVLVTNKKSSPELTEYKKLAIEAERIFQFLCTQKGFDAEFYANNFELLMDYISLAEQVQIAKIEYQKTVAGHKETYCGEVTLNKQAETVNAVGIYSDKTKIQFDQLHQQRLNQEIINSLNKDIALLQKEFEKEVTNKTKLSNDKHHAEFRKKNYILYQKIEQKISGNLVRLQSNREFAKILKNIVKDTSGVKGPNYMGGLKLNVNMMESIGKATISLKLGMQIILMFYIVDSARKVYSASQTGDTKYTIQVTTVETLNIVGGLGGGAVGAWAGGSIGAAYGAKYGIVLAPVSGGASIAVGAVIGGGIGAVIGGVGLGFLGNIAGTKAGRAMTGVCD